MAYEIDQNIKSQRDKFFQSRKDEAKRLGQAQLQQGEDAIQRRFASMGASGSGASIAAMQKNRDAATEAERQAMSDVNAQELQIGEGDATRAFQSKEGETARAFQAGLADKDFSFKQRLADIEQGNKLKELDLAERQFLLDKDTTEFNKRMAEAEAAGGGGEKGVMGDLKGSLVKGGQALDIFNNPVKNLTGSKELGYISNPIGSIISETVPLGGGGK